MPEKIFDILPPKPPTTFREEKQPLVSKKVSLPKIFEKKRWWTPPSRHPMWWGVIPLLVMIAGFFAYFNLPKAEIEIWPEAGVLTLETKLTVDKKVESVNFLNKVIPAKVFDVEKTVSEEFSSSGKLSKAEKARGLIRIYNNYHLDQVLVANTRFQPPLEKFQPPLEKGENPWFRTIERVNIPAKGYVDVKVAAEHPGEKYNIGPSTFSIPGLAGFPQYTLIYGKSFESMKGGVLKEVAQVTQEDLQGAKDLLLKRAKEESMADLKNKIPADLEFLEEAFKIEILEDFSLVKAGAELEKFSYQVKTRTQALVFETEDLKDFAKEFVLSQIPADKKLHQKSLKVKYLPELVNFEVGKITLSINLELKIYSDIDEISLKKALFGKSLAESKISLENQPKITKFQIKLWPFWVKKIPEDLEKIEIKLNVD